MALTQLEKYGATYGLSDTMSTRIQNGMDYIRNQSGWSEFKIPEYIWDYVSCADRNEILSGLEQWFYSYRVESDFASNGLNQDARFAIAYVFTLYQRWWSELATDVARDARLGTSGHESLIADEFNINSGNLRSDGSDDIWITDFDGDEFNINFERDVYDDIYYYTYSTIYPLTNANEPSYCKCEYYIGDEYHNYMRDYSYESTTTCYLSLPETGSSGNWTSYFNSTPRSFCVI